MPEPVIAIPNQSSTPHSSIQPESETFPELSQDLSPENSEIPDVPPNPPEMIDLDAENNASDATLSAMDILPILHCHALTSEVSCEPLYEVTMLELGEATDSPSDQILLAEDDMPRIQQPLECEEQQCFALSVDISDHDVQKWSSSAKPEEMAWVANVCKRARAEVSVKNLSLEEKILFEKAKDAELNCWIQTSALKPILRRKLNPEQILRSRWILTWKAINEEDSTSERQKLV